MYVEQIYVTAPTRLHFLQFICMCRLVSLCRRQFKTMTPLVLIQRLGVRWCCVALCGAVWLAVTRGGPICDWDVTFTTENHHQMSSTAIYNNAANPAVWIHVLVSIAVGELLLEWTFIS